MIDRCAAFFSCAVVACGLALSGTARADTVDEIFLKGVAAYESRDYAAAADAFGSLRDRYGVKSPDVLVNLGSAEFALGRPGPALLHFLGAVKAAPGSKAALTAQVNAERVRAALNKRQGDRPGGGGFVFGRYHDPWIAMLGWLGPLPAAVVFLVMWSVMFVCLGLVRLGGRAGRARLTRWLAVASAIATVLSALAAFGAARVASYRMGVVVRDGAGLLDEVVSEEPSMTMPEGLEVRVVDVRGGFARIRLASGREGFVGEKSIGIP